ncbi:hypothetical protein [Brevifollis gellanilyticus]|uniref:Uncharacterized protein n=1 Tax=Brevifollis gellanilyticus TaxID=748831 RepID=A0A512MIP1_9BACT|nr:hypothetical protein [Brevifollis gellanilyticus]GEP46171.1 hypothetical protein BGE01nite_54620 [Brevifollis gellanilyticus]
MRLRLVTTDRDPFWIVGDPALTALDKAGTAMGERVQLSRSQQSATGAGWDSQIHYDRMNQRVVITATARREFATDWERMSFLCRLAAVNETAQEHLWEGVVWLRLDQPGSTGFREWRLGDAVVGLAGTELEGQVGLRISYTVSCGGFSSEVREGTSEHVSLIGGESPSGTLVELTGTLAGVTSGLTGVEEILNS